MSVKYRFGMGFALLMILTALVIWQGSFTVGDYGPASPSQTYVFWGLSTLIFLLTVLLAFMLFRDAIKLYVARRAGQEGSRIRTKILVGALTLTFLPMIFLVLWSVEVLNRNLDKWFSRPAEKIQLNLRQIADSLESQTRRQGESVARWVADSAELREFLASGHPPVAFFTSVCAVEGVEEAHVQRADGGQIAICDVTSALADPRSSQPGDAAGSPLVARAPIAGSEGEVVVRLRTPLDTERLEREIRQQVSDYELLAAGRKETRRFYLQLLLLITLFILFVASWVALFLARQITAPVTALMEAARKVRGGNLSYRVNVPATDELATLVRAFNEMTQDLEANRDELDRRRRFIEAVLQSIPTGVISLGHDGSIQLMNDALRAILGEKRVRDAHHLSELIPAGHQAEFSRLLKSARRTGAAGRQMEMDLGDGPRQLAVTVSALDARVTSGFVMVIEDTSELLRAQKAAAWHEVARRIAHELKNPLTPIALSSERILRHMERTDASPEARRIIRDCCATIGREVESVKTLVDEFSRFARFPAAQLAPCQLNQVVEEGLAVFHGRLDGVSISKSLAGGLSAVNLDREQFKRVIVNLVDNAAEAMQDAPYKALTVETHQLSPDIVELVIADTGCGITIEDKERLFLPYFSTKGRGTGLGLAIVSHIVAEHHAHIRVEENNPMGARFIIELPALVTGDPDIRPAAAAAEG